MSSSSDDSCQKKKVKTFHRSQKFKNSWLEIAEFKVWLRPVTNNKYKGKCVVCNSEFVSELSTVKKHLNSAKHKNNIKAKKVCGTNILEKFVQSATTSSIHEENLKEAEIRLCGFLAEHNISFLAMDHLSPLLSKIFPDSKIAKDLAVRRTKAKAIITNVISPAHKNDLANTLKVTKFSVLTDESTDIGTMKSACIVVRYFNVQLGQIESSLWELTSVFNDNEDAKHQGTADHLFNKILHTFHKSNIPNQNIIGFASDGCNVMMGEFNSVASRFKNLCPGIFILKCICHSLHLCSAQACKSFPKATEDLARNIYAFFKTSSKRQCDFKQFQMFVEADIHKMLHPSQTRWLSLAAVVKRILEQWSALQLYFNSKWLDERLLSVEQLHQSLNDPFIKLYYLFLNHVLPKITMLNQYFQSDKVVLQNLHTTMVDSYKEFLLCYMQRRYVLTTKLSAIDPSNKTWFIPKNQIYLGIDVLQEIKKPEISERPASIDHFYERCQQFYSILCVEIKKRYDFDNFILSTIHIFSPKAAVAHKTRDQYPSLVDILQHLPLCYDANDAQLIDDEWRLLPNYNITSGEMNIDIKDDIDIFWGKLYKYKNEIGSSIFVNLSRFVLNVLSLPHSNAVCERVFSKVNLIKTKSRNKLITETINGCLLTSQCIKKAGNCTNFVPTKDMLSRMNITDMYPKRAKSVVLESSDTSDDDFILENTE